MSEVKFSKEHEWITIDGEVATIGITKHATEMLGDIVFTELPEKGSSVEKDGTAGVVESTKAASDVYTPISGEVVDTNKRDKLTSFIREFNIYVNRDKRTENLIIPVGDGLTVCRKL